ncbi:hypothetical protein I8751_13565 [Nostocaceae cyanobacterium CENA357]|uniref:Uncharacterized protein n=1 Tax=Atlanticothrix silvestris CENA357 TaxID=1725252 RepID=A0A8J7HJ19_9CYAN|nr:hypothetical protein [Atlanticothrix silvestris]MBH8553383.1 hypothetical protein [Atlanticothrix silvestris CENA357]
MTSKKDIKKDPVYRNRWFERIIAILALLNLCLVVFDMTYIHLRDLYLQVLPSLTQVYDPIEDIQPHPETQNYLNKVTELETQVLQTGLSSPPVESLLEELRLLSSRMIEDNPFDAVNKSGTLAKIKHEIRLRTNEQFAREAFTKFWSQAYLSQQNWQSEINFFNSKIRPLIQSNYYRDIGRFGNFVNHFWLIDLPFVIIFALDFLARTFYISRRNPNLNWLEAMLRRWYDIFLLLPFWRWLRIIPVTIRLYQADLLNLEPLRSQLNHDFAVSFAEEITEMVGIQLIDQMQDTIRQGELARWLFHPETRKPYVQVNERNEVKFIATRLVNIGIYDVLPQVQPNLEALIHHTIASTFKDSPAYQQIQNIPGLNHLPNQLTEKLARNLSQSAYKNLTKALSDPVAAELTSRLMTNFRDVLEMELQKKHNTQEFQSLLIDMLEEIKINYVKGIADSGVEKILDEANQIHKILYK